MKKATTKSERKWGKKEPTAPKETKKDYKEQEDMYKVLIDGSAFSKSMSHTQCLKLIKKYEDKAKFMHQPVPSVVLVKQ